MIKSWSGMTDTAEPPRCLHAATQILKSFYRLATVLVEMTHSMWRVKPMTKLYLGFETVLGSVQQSPGRNTFISSFICLCLCLFKPKEARMFYT